MPTSKRLVGGSGGQTKKNILHHVTLEAKAASTVDKPFALCRSRTTWAKVTPPSWNVLARPFWAMAVSSPGLSGLGTLLLPFVSRRYPMRSPIHTELVIQFSTTCIKASCSLEINTLGSSKLVSGVREFWIDKMFFSFVF